MSDEPRYRQARSYSQLSLYEECAEAYRLKYVEHVREAPSVWSVGGTAFHQVAEWYLRGDLGADPSDDMLISSWQTAWRFAYDDVIRRNPDANPDMRTWRAAGKGKEDAAWWRGRGLQMCHDFVDWKRGPGAGLWVWTADGEAALEMEFRVELAGVPVLAIPDWLAIDEHGQLDIVDYKSGKPPRESTQLGYYRAVVRAATGVDPTWGLYYMARDARVIPVQLDRYDPDEFAQRIARFDAAERAGIYPPHPDGGTCINCRSLTTTTSAEAR